MKGVGGRVKEYMESKGIKQRFVAQKLDVPDSLMSQYLSDTVKMSAEVFLKICEVLEVSPDRFANA